MRRRLCELPSQAALPSILAPVDKSISYGRHHDPGFRIRLGSWGPNTGYSSFSATCDFYSSASIADQICAAVRAGLFGILYWTPEGACS